jgi:two-component response regulator ARR-A family
MTNTTNILLADDDSEDQEILKEALLAVNPALAIHCVMNGKEAISYLENCPAGELPSLIILDYKMPLMNAVETLETLKENMGYTGITKVVWSTSDQSEHKKRCLENGAIRYLVKPGNPTDLALLTRQLLDLIFHSSEKLVTR